MNNKKALDEGYEVELGRLIDEAILKAGSLDRLAEILECDRSTIHRWRSFGTGLKNTREPRARDWYKLRRFLLKEP